MMNYITMTSSTGILAGIGDWTGALLDYSWVAAVGGLLLGACLLIYVGNAIIIAIHKALR